MDVNYHSVIPASAQGRSASGGKAGIQKMKQDAGFPIKSGMTSVWKTSLLYVGLWCAMLGSGVLPAWAVTIDNPLGQRTTTIQGLIQSVISQLTPFALIIATFAIVVIGFKFVVAAVQGDTSGLTAARKNLLWVLVGVAVIVAANVIATAVKTFLSGL